MSVRYYTHCSAKDFSLYNAGEQGIRDAQHVVRSIASHATLQECQPKDNVDVILVPVYAEQQAIRSDAEMFRHIVTVLDNAIHNPSHMYMQHACVMFIVYYRREIMYSKEQSEELSALWLKTVAPLIQKRKDTTWQIGMTCGQETDRNFHACGHAPVYYSGQIAAIGLRDIFTNAHMWMQRRNQIHAREHELVNKGVFSAVDYLKYASKDSIVYRSMRVAPEVPIQIIIIQHDQATGADLTHLRNGLQKYMTRPKGQQIIVSCILPTNDIDYDPIWPRIHILSATTSRMKDTPPVSIKESCQAYAVLYVVQNNTRIQQLYQQMNEYVTQYRHAPVSMLVLCEEFQFEDDVRNLCRRVECALRLPVAPEYDTYQSESDVNTVPASELVSRMTHMTI